MKISVLIVRAFLWPTLLLFTLNSQASVSEWKINPEQSSIIFTATQNNAPVSGELTQFSGKIFADANNLKESSIHIIIDMSSIKTAYGELTKTLLSPDWFNVNTFPKAEFTANKFEKIEGDTYKADGMLIIRDKTAPISLSFTAKISPDNKAIVEGTTTFKRSTFGVGQGEWASVEEIKDEVKVNFKILANKI